MRLEASVYWSSYQVSCFAHSHVLLVEPGDCPVILECIICLRSIFSSLLAFHYVHFLSCPQLSLHFSSLFTFLTNLHILSRLLSSHSQHILLSLLFLSHIWRHFIIYLVHYVICPLICHIFVFCSK